VRQTKLAGQLLLHVARAKSVTATTEVA